MKKILTLILILCCARLYSQDLISGRKTSYYTYIYKISDNDAGKIYQNRKIDIDKDCLYQLVDSFPTDSTYLEKLNPGHYLKVNAEKNKLNFSISTVYPFELQIVDNKTDLLIQVYDLAGRQLNDLIIKSGLKTIPFDKKSNAYLLRKSNRHGLLGIKYQGCKYYFDLEKQFKNSATKRFTRKLVYSTPLKYAWIPVNYVIHLPIDGVKSISKHYPYGTIWMTKNFFVKLYERTACLFDDYYCDENRFSNQYKTFLVFNKPKYLPGDTVKFKAFICKKNGQPIDRKVDVIFYNGTNKSFKLNGLEPYRKGAYAYQFYLHDSLDLKLDKNCEVSLEKRSGKSYVSGLFRYEDYELSSVNLNLRYLTQEQFKGKDFEIYASGKDENGLSLPDARIQLLIKPDQVNEYFDSCVFVPDTLFYLEKPLETTGETKINIPDSIFPKVNLTYELEARLLSSDNDLQKKDLKIFYYYKKQDATLTIQQDSMVFRYFEDGIEKNTEAGIIAVDGYGNQTDMGIHRMLFKERINPYFSEYLFVKGNFRKSLSLKAQNAPINCYTSRSSDSIHFTISNPSKIPFNYFLYRHNHEVLKGYGQSFEYHERTNSKQNYILSIQYLWGGKMETRNYLAQLTENKLNVEVIGPSLVYPGQKTKISLKVTDQKGKPVPDADITALGLTKKFNYQAPNVPVFEKYRKNKEIINSFTISSKDKTEQRSKDLNFEKWKKLTGLDSIEYYRFIYPGNKMYQFTYTSKDGITQFSPFVVKDGKIQAIHVIYVDRLPVYFSWATNVQPYTFRITPGYHQISIRTATDEYTIDSLYFEKGKRLIFSFSDLLEIDHNHMSKLKPELSKSEKSNLYRYVMPYRYTFGNNLAFIKQDDNLIYLKSSSGSYYGNCAGPVYPRSLTFNLLDAFKTDFSFEPGFEYEFQNGLLKMRSKNLNNYLWNLNYKAIEKLDDQLIRKSDIRKEWNDYIDRTRFNYLSEMPYFYYQNRKAKIILHYKDSDKGKDNQPLFILFKGEGSTNYYRIRFNQTYYLNVSGSELVELVLIYPGQKYAIIDSLQVKNNGLNYFGISKPKSMVSGIFNPEMRWEELQMEIISKTDVKNEFSKEDPLKYNETDKENWRKINGRITDEEGFALPGVNIRVKSTQIGTVSDMEGKYTISVPNEASELVISSIGMKTENRKIDGDFLETRLSEDNVALDEVVVVGYGITRKSDCTGSVVSVSGLQGKCAGVQITENSGIPGASDGTIRIRGVSGTDNAQNPLYIIDGVVYTGSELKLDPNQIEKMDVMKGENAFAIYGSRAVNGVILITTKGGFTFEKGKEKEEIYDDTFYEAAMSANSIRSNFSDDAFWQPKLTTGKDGTASFEVVFPDDITGWDTHFLAMNGKKKSGQTSGFIKSFKPLMAQLLVPRFMVTGDSANIIGKAKNLTGDTISITTKLEKNGSLCLEKEKQCAEASIDAILISAENTDSLKLKYFLEKPDGYFDGEKKEIPVFAVGLEETKGQFFVLDKDTTITPQFDPGLSSVCLYAKDDELEVIADEIKRLIDYQYACNEQLASRLKGLISLKYICKLKNEKFKYEKQTKEIIKLLLKNRQDNGLWGWWNRDGLSYWISMHVLEALMDAKSDGYDVKIDKPQLFDNLLWELEKNTSIDQKIRILYLMKQYGVQIDYKKYMEQLEKQPNKRIYDDFSIIELKQRCGLPVKTDTLFHFAQRTLFGNLYFRAKEDSRWFYEDETQLTLLAYRIIRRDTSINCDSLLKIRNYLFENCRNGYWRNTYESAKIIETILPDIKQAGKRTVKPTITISGDIYKSINQFPFEMKLDPKNKISINKTGDYPVYLTTYQRYWNPEPKQKSNDFAIQTYFEGHQVGHPLISGKTYTLVAIVDVKKDAEFAMIEIPIPASCSYNEKSVRNWNEVHREYFKHKVSIFCEYLKEGTHAFRIDVNPRYTGIYALNPAKVELMYFPTFNANNEVKKVNVE